MKNKRVAVIGGGVLGTSIAAQLAEAGADVVLITAGRLADGASGRSLSWLNSFWTRNPQYHQLRLLGIDRYRTLAARVPESTGYLRFDGGLTWAAPGEDSHRKAYEYLRSVGYDAELLEADQVATRTPGVAAEAIGDSVAVFNPGEGWVDLPWLVGQLSARLLRAGGSVLSGQGPTEIVVENDVVSGVRSASGLHISVDSAVLATGPAVPGTLAKLGVTIPDATTPALLLRTRPVRTALRATLNTPRVAIRPAPGDTLVMDSGWSEREVELAPDGSITVRPDTVTNLLAAGREVLSGHPELAVASFGAGLKPVPGGDGESVVGGIEGIAGYHIAFTHSGATLGLILGELLADEVVSGQPHPLLAGFRAARFAADRK